MSINACTINCSQIDDICSYRRAAIISTLPPFIPTAVGGGQQQKVNANYENLGIFRRQVEDDTVDVSTLEMPAIAVTIEFNGQTYLHTLERGDETMVPLITVHGLKIANSILETVNISDVRLIKR